MDNDRDCIHCKHYKQWSPDYGLDDVWSCESWECDFEPIEDDTDGC